MRLKEDRSNWRASNIIRKVQLIPDEPVRIHHRKNTKKWCRGKVGVEHQWAEETLKYDFGKYTFNSMRDWKVYEQICKICGKEKTRSHYGTD